MTRAQVNSKQTKPAGQAQTTQNPPPIGGRGGPPGKAERAASDGE